MMKAFLPSIFVLSAGLSMSSAASDQQFITVFDASLASSCDPNELIVEINQHAGTEFSVMRPYGDCGLIMKTETAGLSSDFLRTALSGINGFKFVESDRVMKHQKLRKAFAE